MWKWLCVCTNCLSAETPAECPDLDNPDNGRVDYETQEGSTVTYTCNTGYQLDVASTRTCQSDGTWSGSAPTCTRMYVLKWTLLWNCQNYIIHSKFLMLLECFLSRAIFWVWFFGYKNITINVVFKIHPYQFKCTL